MQEKALATRSSVLAWGMPGTGESDGCRLWGRTESDMTEATQQQQQHPFPSPGDLPNPGIKPRSLALQADSLPAEPQEKPEVVLGGKLSTKQLY